MNVRQAVEIIDALALFHALERQASGFSASVDHVAYIDDDNEPRIEFTVARDAVDGNGYHVGYERFFGVLPMFSFKRAGLNGATSQSEFFTMASALDVDAIEPAIEMQEYTEQDAIEYLNENGIPYDDDEADVLQFAYDNMLGEGDYCPPDYDFAWHELEQALSSALDDMPTSWFAWSETTGNHRHWLIGWTGEEPADVYCLDCKGECNV